MNDVPLLILTKVQMWSFQLYLHFIMSKKEYWPQRDESNTQKGLAANEDKRRIRTDEQQSYRKVT